MIKGKRNEGSIQAYAKGLFFAGFLYSGYFKESVYFRATTIDLTVLFGVLTVLTIIYTLVIRPFRIPSSIYWVLALHVLCAIPVFWTVWSGYAEQKILRMFTITLLAAIAPPIIFRRDKDISAFFKCVVFCAALIAVDTIVNWRAGVLKDDRLISFIREIALGRIMAVASLWFLFHAITQNNLVKVIYFLISAVFLILMIGAGARGPVLAFVIALLLISWIIIGHGRKAVLLSVLLILTVVVGSYALRIAPRASHERLIEFLTGTTDLRATQRPLYFGLALDNIIKNPAGIGWGGFEELSTGGFSKNINRVYPHNLILEAFLEGGWVVGSFLCLFIGTAIYRSLKKARECFSSNQIFGLAFLVFLLVSVSFSNDWNDSRDFFALLSLAMATSIDTEKPRPKYNKKPILV